MNLKKLFIFSAICTLAFATNVSADTKKTCENYTAEEYNYIVKNTDPVDLDTTCSNGTLYTDEYLLQLENELDKSLINSSVQPRYYVNKLSVTNYRQDNGYYCGPANVKQVVQYLNGSSASQSTYASYMETNSIDGTYVYAIRNALNNYTSQSYSYVLGSNYNASSFSTLVKNKITANKPIILHSNTGSLSMYNGTSLGHYLTVNGYTYTASFGGSTGIDNIYYVDTWYGSYGNGSVLGEHMDTATNVFNTVNSSSRYIIQ